MLRIVFSLLALVFALAVPAATPSVSGGGAVPLPALDDCEGKSGVVSCTPANGATCSDLSNVYVVADAGERNKLPGSGEKTCKKQNGNNNDCAGSAYLPNSKKDCNPK